MPIARTYDKYSLYGEPFEENKHMYVYIITSKGNKKVRWYTDAERAAQDRKAGIAPVSDIMDFNARHAFGFREPGFITIYKGDKEELDAFVESHRASFWGNLTFGHYTPAHIPVPSLPASITPIRLNWEEVMDYDNRMRPHPEVAKLVAQKLGAEITGTYQGNINDWLEKQVTIQKNVGSENYFGEKHIHYMKDNDGNLYIWETGAKNFPAGTQLKLKMKVKDHQEIDCNKYTIVWYCKEVK